MDMDHGNEERAAAVVMSEQEADALTESFRVLTAKLVVLHRRALDGASADGAIPAGVREDIFALMKEAFVDTQDSEPTKVFNFMIYLISVVSSSEAMDAIIQHKIIELGHMVNKFATTIGMAPVIGGADVQDPQWQAP